MHERSRRKTARSKGGDSATQGLLLDSIFENMAGAHHQADLVQLFTEVGDVRGVHRQLTFLVEYVQRAVQDSAALTALRSEITASTTPLERPNANAPTAPSPGQDDGRAEAALIAIVGLVRQGGAP